MAIIVDSGFVYGLLDADDKHHLKIADFMGNLPNEPLILPTLTLVEITYFLAKNLGHLKMRAFIAKLDQFPMKLVSVDLADMPRIYEILEKYHDNELDFVDASIVVLAERMRVTKILTVDKRDFRMIRPLHCDYFEILP